MNHNLEVRDCFESVCRINIHCKQSSQLTSSCIITEFSECAERAFGSTFSDEFGRDSPVREKKKVVVFVQYLVQYLCCYR